LAEGGKKVIFNLPVWGSVVGPGWVRWGGVGHFGQGRPQQNNLEP